MSSELPSLIGRAPSFLELMEQVARAAPLDRPVLVIGERGTGKELIASRLHYLSTRWDRPLLTLNAAAIPETLLESELFGHEAGAFTGALRRRAGRFEAADGGSLFLDEIANTSLAVQERLLRVVEYGTFDRLGGSATMAVDVRLIGATNEDLPALAAAGRFRHDLLDRLAFDVLTVPPLCAREEDIALLADHFGRAMAFELGWEGFAGFTDAALDRLHAHPWPGNVRELKNVVERAVYRAPSASRPVAEVTFDPFDSPYRPRSSRARDLEPSRQGPDGQPAPGGAEASGEVTDLRAAVAGYERACLVQGLAGARHNQRLAARRLGLTYDQLRHRLRKHGLLGDGDAGDRAP